MRKGQNQTSRPASPPGTTNSGLTQRTSRGLATLSLSPPPGAAG